MNPRCAICSAATTKVLDVHDFEVFECERCSHRMLPPMADAAHVEKIYGDDYFFGGGAGYPDYLRDEHLLRRRGRWYGRLVARYRDRPGRLLEIGAAAGFSLKAFSDQGWEVVGLEPNDSMASYGRETLGLDVRTGTIENLETQTAFDLVCLLQVISHLVSPSSAIRRIAELITPPGLVLIETWNWRSLTALALGRRWHQYSPPSVLHWFCDQSLERLMNSCGFERVATGRAWKRISWAHARSLLAFKLGKGAAGAAFDRLSRLVPRRLVLPYLFDDARWYLFGVSSSS